MKKVIKHWIAKASSVGTAEALHKTLVGGIDLVSPSMINGWVWHPEYELYDVRLLAGSCLLATAKIDIERKDVEEKVGKKGNHAFSLKLPVSLPSADLMQDLRLVALTADGAVRFPLFCMKDKSATLTLLRTALDPKYFGMQGNFDGLTSDRLILTGWCFQTLMPSKTCTVYIQVEGMKPVPIECDQSRPGFSRLGYPECCGFVFHLAELADLPDLEGKRLVVTFDQSGLLPLPEASPCFLPRLASTRDLALSKTSQSSLSGENTYEVLETHSLPEYSHLPDLAKYRRDLEEFKRICDIFEREITAQIKQETFSKGIRDRRKGGWRRLFGGKS